MIVRQVVPRTSAIHRVGGEGIDRVAFLGYSQYIDIRRLIADIVGVFHFAAFAIERNDAERHRQIGVSRTRLHRIDAHGDATGFHGYIRHLAHRTVLVHEVDTSVAIDDHEVLGGLVQTNMRNGIAVQAVAVIPVFETLVRAVEREECSVSGSEDAVRGAYHFGGVVIGQMEFPSHHTTRIQILFFVCRLAFQPFSAAVGVEAYQTFGRTDPYDASFVSRKRDDAVGR